MYQYGKAGNICHLVEYDKCIDVVRQATSVTRWSMTGVPMWYNTPHLSLGGT